METRVWLNRSQPQTLYNANILLYFRAGIAVLFGLFSGLSLILAAGYVAAGYGIANERRLGYQAAVALAFLPAVLRFLFQGITGILGIDIISLAFEILLIALLLHPQSRDHQRIWFK